MVAEHDPVVAGDAVTGDDRDLDATLDDLVKSGRMTPGEADEVRRYAAFLADAGPPPPAPGADPQRAAAAFRKHYGDRFPGLS